MGCISASRKQIEGVVYDKLVAAAFATMTARSVADTAVPMQSSTLEM